MKAIVFTAPNVQGCQVHVLTELPKAETARPRHRPGVVHVPPTPEQKATHEAERRARHLELAIACLPGGSHYLVVEDLSSLPTSDPSSWSFVNGRVQG